MKSFSIIANLKANLSIDESENWIKEFSQKYTADKNISVIIAPTFLNIASFHKEIIKLENVYLACQDVSIYNKGSHTGEIPVEFLSQHCQYAIIGHSERRAIHFQNNFYHEENNEIIEKKINNCIEVGVKPIVCFSRLDQISNIASGVDLFAYEPPEAIGSGNFATIDSVKMMAQSSSDITRNHFLYGGSVDKDNIQSFISQDFINGVILATAAKDVSHFLEILQIAGKYLIQYYS